MVDPERLHRLLRRVTDDLRVLEGYRAAEGLAADPVRMGHVKYTFVTMLEACLDCAHHVCASAGYGPPDTNADTMRLLGAHGALTGATADAMASAAGFRNLLVHGYARVDDLRVVAFLERLDDVDDFVRQLSSLL